MSYNMAITVKDGQASVVLSGDVPDGHYDVHGHEDQAQRSFGVARKGLDGRYVQAASSTHYKEA